MHRIFKSRLLQSAILNNKNIFDALKITGKHFLKLLSKLTYKNKFLSSFCINNVLLLY